MSLRLHLDTYLCLLTHLPRATPCHFASLALHQVPRDATLYERSQTGYYGGRLLSRHASTSASKAVPVIDEDPPPTNSEAMDHVHLQEVPNEEISTATRSFPTDSVESNNHDLLTWLPVDLPVPPPRPQDLPNAFQPLRPHSLPPVARSKDLSTLHCLTSITDPTPAVAEDIYQIYSRLYLSSPHSHVFTPSELSSIIHTLRTAQTRYPINRRRYAERIQAVVDELKAVLGPNINLDESLQAKLISLSTRTRRRIDPEDLSTAEKEFETCHRSLPTSSAALITYRMRINHLLYLSASLGTVKRFDQWWRVMKKTWRDADSHAVLARMIMLVRTGRVNLMTELLDSTLKRVDPSTRDGQEAIDKDDAIVLINFALWTLAKREEWEIISPAYGRLRPSSHPPFESLFDTETPKPPSQPNSHFFSSSIFPNRTIISLSFPKYIKPTRQTYTLLIQSLSFRGHLFPALQILQHMLEDEQSPGVPEYIALFRGFAKFGQIPPGRSGELARFFPRWDGGEDIYRSGGMGERLTEIWERGVMGSESSFSTSRSRQEVSQWTFEILQDLLNSFFSILPSTGNDLSPTPRAVFMILLAVARTSNGDIEAVEGVWNKVLKKFGEGNTEGWVGWREDKRIKRLRAVMESGYTVEDRQE